MSALRERPRVVAAQVLGIVALLAIGFVLGGALKGDPEPKTPADVQQRLDRLERTAARQEKEIKARRPGPTRPRPPRERQARALPAPPAPRRRAMSPSPSACSRSCSWATPWAPAGPPVPPRWRSHSWAPFEGLEDASAWLYFLGVASASLVSGLCGVMLSERTEHRALNCASTPRAGGG